MKILAIIPARGGSKGVPRKNIKLLNGRPLIYYSIETALKLKIFDEVMVSTDDDEIACIAKSFGAQVPFIRPKELANDNSPTIDTIIHVLKSYMDIGKRFDIVCILQPTTPFRSKITIKDAINKFLELKYDSLISVRLVPHQYNPHWTFEINHEKSLLQISTGESVIISRRQDLPPAYYRDGSIYLVNSNIVLNQKSLYGSVIGYIINNDSLNINIDTIDDWLKAEEVAKYYKNL